MVQQCFIVTSVIDPSDKPLSYHHTRSIFTPAQRVQQTLNTIHSIKSFYPDAAIILLEWGHKSYEWIFNKEVAEYLHLGKHYLVQKAINSYNKSLWEVVLLLFGLWYMTTARGWQMFKMSGRYSLNSHHTKSDYWVDRAFRYIGKSVSTKLYSLWRKSKYSYYSLLILSLPFVLIGKSVEWTLGFLLSLYSHNRISLLWVEGQAWPIWTLYSE